MPGRSHELKPSVTVQEVSPDLGFAVGLLPAHITSSRFDTIHNGRGRGRSLDCEPFDQRNGGNCDMLQDNGRKLSRPWHEIAEFRRDLDQFAHSRKEAVKCICFHGIGFIQS